LTKLLSGPKYAELGHKIERLKEQELELLSERDTAVYLQAETMRWTVWSGVALDVLLLMGAAWVIRDALLARRREADALQSANAQLEVRVSERTAELSVSNETLHTENLERQWTNQALEHQLRYNQNIVDSITDLILVLTKSVNISRVNPAVRHMTRWDTTDLINQPLSKVLKLVATDGAEHEDLQHKAMRLMKEGRDLRDKSAELIDRNQKRIPVRFYLYPLRDDNKVIGAVAVLQLTHSEPESKG
jgi:PAS domain-containing protein